MTTENSTDFLRATDADIAKILEDHTSEFGFPEDPVSATDILARLASGDTEVTRFPHGVALVRGVERPCRSLWLLYVDPSHRGAGLGRGYVKEVVGIYGATHYVGLKCHKRLRPFYGSLGFRVRERNGDIRVMEGPYRRGEVSSWLL